MQILYQFALLRYATLLLQRSKLRVSRSRSVAVGACEAKRYAIDSRTTMQLNYGGGGVNRLQHPTHHAFFRVPLYYERLSNF